MNLHRGNLIFVSSLLVFSMWAGKQRGTPTSVEVAGYVSDANGARVADANVTLQDHGREYSTLASNDGRYFFRVTPGVYWIRVTHPGFCEARRGDFYATLPSAIRFDFRLEVCPYDDVRTRYEFEVLPPVLESHLRPLVLYGERTASSGVFQYKGPVISGRNYPVDFTVGLLTVDADNLTYQERGHLVVATGQVSYQDQGQTLRGSRIEIVLQGRRAKVSSVVK
jgi:Carboxypeptidase regulatory-like domain